MRDSQLVSHRVVRNGLMLVADGTSNRSHLTLGCGLPIFTRGMEFPVTAVQADDSCDEMVHAAGM